MKLSVLIEFPMFYSDDKIKSNIQMCNIIKKCFVLPMEYICRLTLLSSML